MVSIARRSRSGVAAVMAGSPAGDRQSGERGLGPGGIGPIVGRPTRAAPGRALARPDRRGDYHRRVPRLRPPARRRARRPRIVVVGDLVLDVVLAPDRPLEVGIRRPRARVPRPGRIRRHDRPLAGSTGREGEPRLRGRAGCHGPGAGGGAAQRWRDTAGRARARRPDRPDRRARDLGW